MTVHSTSFQTDQPVSPAGAEALLPAAVAAAPQLHAERKLNLRKLLLTGAAIAALAGAAWYGWNYWTVGQYLVSTDDAYVRADSTTIAPKVTGYLQQVLVKDNERVRHLQAEVGQESVEPVGHHALEQRRLVRHQAIQRLGGDAGAAGHGFGAGRGDIRWRQIRAARPRR